MMCKKLFKTLSFETIGIDDFCQSCSALIATACEMSVKVGSFLLSFMLNLSQAQYIIHSFTHSGHFYSAPSSPLPLRGAPDYSTDTVSEFHAEAHRQLQVKDLPKVPT